MLSKLNVPLEMMLHTLQRYTVTILLSKVAIGKSAIKLVLLLYWYDYTMLIKLDAGFCPGISYYSYGAYKMRPQLPQ
jgi:hypothetical protein